MKFERLPWLDSDDGKSRTYKTNCKLAVGPTGKFLLRPNCRFDIPARLGHGGSILIGFLCNNNNDGKPIAALSLEDSNLTIWVNKGAYWQNVDQLLDSKEAKAVRRRMSAKKYYEKINGH